MPQPSETTACKLILDYEKRAGEDNKAVLKSLISATMHLKRGTERLAGAEMSTSDRRAEAIRQLYDFRARLGLDDETPTSPVLDDQTTIGGQQRWTELKDE